MDTLDRLAAKDAIADATRRYSRGIDRCDADLVKSACHADATLDYGTFKGNAWEFATAATTSLRRYKATMHAMTNHSINDLDVATGTATGEIYVNAYHLREDDGKQTVDWWWGRYLDQYTRQDGEWRIFHRICVHEWTMQLPIEQAMPIASHLFQSGSFDRKA